MCSRGILAVLSFVAILASCIPNTMQASAPIAKCGTTPVVPSLAGLDEARAACANESSQACKIACVWKKVAILNENNKFSIGKYTGIHRSFPRAIQMTMLRYVMKCTSLGAGIPHDLDPTCSEFEPLAVCVGAAVSKSCDILDGTVFWKY